MSGLNPCCISGAIAEGTPTGKDSKLGGIATYIATPPTANSRAVVICSDVFGYQLPNTRLIADALAKVMIDSQATSAARAFTECTYACHALHASSCPMPLNLPCTC